MQTAQEVIDRERMDTPSGIGVDCGVRSRDTRFTFPREPVAADRLGENSSENGDPDGEGMEIPCAIPGSLSIRPKKRIQMAMSTGKSMGDIEAIERQHMRDEGSMCKRQKVEDPKKTRRDAPSGEDKRREIARWKILRARASYSHAILETSAEEASHAEIGDIEIPYGQSAEVGNRKVAVKELQAERRALGQEPQSLKQGNGPQGCSKGKGG